MYGKDINSSSTYCSQIKAFKRASKKLKLQTSLRSGGAAEEGSGESRKPRHPQTHGNQRRQLCFFVFAVFSILYDGGKPSKMSWIFGEAPIREHSPAKKSLCGNPEDILLDLSGAKKVSGCNVKNRFWHAESPSPLQSALRLLPGTAEGKKKGSRHQPALKAIPAITDKDKTGLSDSRPAAGNDYCLGR